MSVRPLHVLVGVAESSELAFSIDLQLVKAALLYGDAVTLCSPMASLIARVLHTSPEAALDTLIALADDFDLGDGPRQLADARAALIAEAEAPFRSERIERLDRIAREWWEQVQGALQARVHAGGHSELAAAAHAGKLYLDPLDIGALALPSDAAPVVLDAYAHRIDTALSGLSVPLLDGATLDLLRQRAAGIAEPFASSNGQPGGRGREGGLVADWLPRLPLFDLATVDEVLGIRRELDAHIARFRAAVIGFAEAVGPAVWDADFPLDAERLFRREVAPTVADIQDAIEMTGPLRALVSRYAERPGLLTPFAPALALGLAGASIGAEIGALALAGGSLAANAAHAWWLDRDVRREAESHPLFFYYAAEERLRVR
ncbi:MAG: hypothetical protein Rubg2KO_36210 [Rubricoccaceae bacterium]